MTKKNIRRQQPAPAIHFTWLGVAIVALLLVGGGIVAWYGLSSRTTTPPQVTGAPRLVVGQTTIDAGDVKFGKPIRNTFRLQNVGDQSLQILGEPEVEIVEGC